MARFSYNLANLHSYDFHFSCESRPTAAGFRSAPPARAAQNIFVQAENQGAALVRPPAALMSTAPQCIVYTAAADLASQFPRSVIRGAESERCAAATMLPYIHLGPLTLGTYGLLLATALLCGFCVLRAEMNRRRLAADPETIIGLVGLAGLVGAKLWHVLETPADFFAHPLQRIFTGAWLFATFASRAFSLSLSV